LSAAIAGFSVAKAAVGRTAHHSASRAIGAATRAAHLQAMLLNRPGFMAALAGLSNAVSRQQRCGLTRSAARTSG
jgi:hypothetical protein